MFGSLRRIFRRTLRDQLEDGVREALRRYADRRTAPDLRVYVSSDLLPPGVDPTLWARDEAEHLRRFAAQWAEDHGIARTGLRVEVIVLDTKREFAFVKPVGLEEPPPAGAAPLAPSATPASGAGRAWLRVVESPALPPTETLVVEGTLVVGRRPDSGVHALHDRYMSARHARFEVRDGRLWVTDLDSKNRTFVNDEPIPPHEPVPLAEGDRVRMGTTVLQVARVG
mgnify:CR=1 FL=1